MHYRLVGATMQFNPSPLFDTAFFLSALPFGEDIECPLEAYLLGEIGVAADPHPLFSSTYVAQQAGINAFPEPPLIHYLRRRDLRQDCDPHPLLSRRHLQEAGVVGDWSRVTPIEAFLAAAAVRNIDPHPIFDTALYRYQIEIERGEKLDEPAIVHYLKGGFRDRLLLPNLLFDPAFYHERNGLDEVGPELVHYLLEGDRLGLACHPLFSAKFYNEQRTDGLGSMSALGHMARFPEQGLRTDFRMTRPPDPTIVQFMRRLVDREEAFDGTFYRAVNPDLQELDDEALKAHYANHGRAENRPANERCLMRQAKATVRELPVGLYTDEYLYLNRDIADLSGNPEGALSHYLLHGRHEVNRMIGKWQFHLDGIVLHSPTGSSPLRIAATKERREVCILIHIYYTDIWTELAAFAHNFRERTYDMYINLVDSSWTPEVHHEIRELCPGAFLQLSNDNGRDIGGFSRLLDNIEFDRYEILAFMHTKKSPHIAPERAEHWRRTLLKAFAGSTEIANACVEMFQQNPSIGMIGSKEWRSDEMGKNQDQYERLLDLLGIEGEHRQLDYLSGTMLLLRSTVVKRLHSVLRALEWEYGGDNVLEFHIDGQIAHGVERAIPALVRHMGYEVVWR